MTYHLSHLSSSGVHPGRRLQRKPAGLLQPYRSVEVRNLAVSWWRRGLVRHINHRSKHVKNAWVQIWVCLKIGYIPNYSHLIGIMISKTIGFRGTLFSDKPICSDDFWFNLNGLVAKHDTCRFLLPGQPDWGCTMVASRLFESPQMDILLTSQKRSHACFSERKVTNPQTIKHGKEM